MKYHLGDILSVLSGRNLSPSGMAGVLALLHAVAGDEAGTNLVRACDRTAAELRRRFPELAAIPVPPPAFRLSPFGVPPWCTVYAPCSNADAVRI